MPQPPHPLAVAEGWYEVPGVPGTPGAPSVRWWTGTMWGGLAVRDGAVKADPNYSAAPTPALWVVAGFLGLVGAARTWASFAGSRFDAFTLAQTVFVWVLAAAMAYVAVVTMRIRNLPRPVTPAAPAAVQPLPGTIEGPDAGWYPAPTPDHERYWSGARWSHYVWSRGTITPTFAFDRLQARSQLALTVFASVLGLLAVTGLIAALVLPSSLKALGVAMAVAGVIGAAITGGTSAMIARRRRTHGIPADPPLR